MTENNKLQRAIEAGVRARRERADEERRLRKQEEEDRRCREAEALDREIREVETWLYDMIEEQVSHGYTSLDIQHKGERTARAINSLPGLSATHRVEPSGDFMGWSTITVTWGAAGDGGEEQGTCACGGADFGPNATHTPHGCHRYDPAL